MKIKHVISTLCLSTMAVVGLAAGFSVKSNNVKATKADADTWMVNFSLNAKDITGYEGFDPSSMYVHTYTDGVGGDKYFQMYPIKSSIEDTTFFQVNATFPASYSYDRVQFKFTQSGVEKWATSYTTEGSEESHPVQVYSTFYGWSGDNWTFTLNTSPNLYVKYNDVTYHLEADVANARYIARDVVSDETDYLTFLYRQEWEFCWTALTDSSKDYTYGSHADNWANLSAGTYDFVLKNNNSDNGILEIIKHEPANVTYIYYVLEDNVATTDYIYSWGGSSQFGSWPGTQITSIEGVQEVSGNGVLHFQGSETPKLIYKIPVTIGYPTGDSQFKFNNNNDWESDAGSLVAGAAYWYTAIANEDAGEAIDFLVTLESKRNAATDYSVCNISKEDATALCNTYAAIDSNIRTTYIDCSGVWTYNPSGEGNAQVAVSAIMTQLAIIAGITPSAARLSIETSSSMFIIVAVIAASVILLSIVLLKKKKATR